MRDYVDLISRARQNSTPLSAELADALEELHNMARRMTALGADLEAQIQDDLTADYYALVTDDNPLTLMVSPETLKGMTLPPQLPAKWTALKVIGESWIVKLGEDEEPSEFYSREELDQAVADIEEEK